MELYITKYQEVEKEAEILREELKSVKSKAGITK